MLSGNGRTFQMRICGSPASTDLGYSGLAIGVDRSEEAFRGFLSRKTTPRELFGTTVIAKPL